MSYSDDKEENIEGLEEEEEDEDADLDENDLDDSLLEDDDLLMDLEDDEPFDGEFSGSDESEY